MKKHQFEELTAALSVVIAILAYRFDIDWLFYIYTAKAILDTWAAIKAARKSHYRSLEKKSTRYNPYEDGVDT
jgi:hypothetical protein